MNTASGVAASTKDIAAIVQIQHAAGPGKLEWSGQALQRTAITQAQINELFQRRGKNLCRKVRKAAKVLLGFCKCSHIVTVDTTLEGATQIIREGAK